MTLLLMKISISKTRAVLFLCIALILILNQLHLFKGVEVNGDDALVVYKFYSGLVDGYSFQSFINFYGNSDLFVLLPALTYLLYQITPALSLSEFTYIISSLTDLLIVSAAAIYTRKNYTNNNVIIGVVLFLFIVLFPYGMTIQLSRQSLCIGFFIIGLANKKIYLRNIFLFLCLITHVIGLYFILFYLIHRYIKAHNKKYAYTKLAIWAYFFLPLVILLFFNFESPLFYSGESFFDSFDSRDKIYFILLVFISIFNIKANKSILWLYFLSLLIYHELGLGGFHQRIFLLNYIFINPVIILNAVLSINRFYKK